MKTITYRDAIRAAAIHEDVVAVIAQLFDAPVEMVGDHIEAEQDKLRLKTKQLRVGR